MDKNPHNSNETNNDLIIPSVEDTSTQCGKYYVLSSNIKRTLTLWFNLKCNNNSWCTHEKTATHLAFYLVTMIEL